MREINNIYRKKSQKIEIEINQKIKEYKEALIKEAVGKNKTFSKISVRRYNDLSKKITTTKKYYSWTEDFVDEDTGEVVNVERTLLISVHKLIENNFVINPDNRIIEELNIYDSFGNIIKMWQK